MTNDTNRDFLTPQFERQVERFAEKFRVLADRIEQVGRLNAASAHPCSSAAADVVHEINSALANMPFWPSPTRQTPTLTASVLLLVVRDEQYTALVVVEQAPNGLPRRSAVTSAESGAAAGGRVDGPDGRGARTGGDAVPCLRGGRAARLRTGLVAAAA